MVDSVADLGTKAQLTFNTYIEDDKIFKEATWPKGDFGKSKYKYLPFKLYCSHHIYMSIRSIHRLSTGSNHLNCKHLSLNLTFS